MVESVPVTDKPKKIEVKDAPPKPVFSRLDRLKHFLKTKKGITAASIALLVVVIAVLLVVPATRYGIVGTFIKKNVSVTVVDSNTKQPVSGVAIKLASHTSVTDSKGAAKFTSVPVGHYTITAAKKYYKSSTAPYTVPILSAPSTSQLRLAATGRTIEISVTNKITAKALTGAQVSFEGTTTQTDSKGVASVVLAPSATAQKGTVKKDGYNDVAIELTVKNEDNQKLSIGITPIGKLYFLSKRTGKIDVMSSNLDGTNQQVVVAGTGQESDASTVLLSTTDWKYLLLQASRDSDKPKLYLLNASNGQLTTIDEGDVDFQLVGWSGHQFVYLVDRNTPNIWDNKRHALKSYNAETNKLTTIYETQGTGIDYSNYAAESIANVYIVSGQIIYSKVWDFNYGTAVDRMNAIISATPGSQTNNILKGFSSLTVSSFDARAYEPQAVYYRAVPKDGSAGTYFEVEDGKATQTTSTNDQKFYNTFYATYLISPSGQRTFWYEARDGKNAVFVGGSNAETPKELAPESEFTPYGWFSDDYILFSKNGSELYIAGSGDTLPQNMLKISDYHKAQLNFPGYGSGYGGQ